METSGVEPTVKSRTDWVKFADNGVGETKDNAANTADPLHQNEMADVSLNDVVCPIAGGSVDGADAVDKRPSTTQPSALDEADRTANDYDEAATARRVQHSGRTGASAPASEVAFDNGEVIVTLLPVNERLPWITRAKFRPELVPEELMSPALTLTVEEYCQTIDSLGRDVRFVLYNMLYKRILIIWIVLGFAILLTLLFAGFKGVALFASGVMWLIVNAAAIFLCMYIKLQLNTELERCVGTLNANLRKHHIVLGVDDRGNLSCHKVNLCFIYLDATKCITRLRTVLNDEHKQIKLADGTVVERDATLYSEGFLPIGPAAGTIKRSSTAPGMSLKEQAEALYSHYVQRWAKEYLRRRLDWRVDDAYGDAEYASNTNPRHIKTALCPCQFIEDHLRHKRRRESLRPHNKTMNPCYWCD